MEQGWGSIESTRAQMGTLSESSSTALLLHEASGQRQLCRHSLDLHGFVTRAQPWDRQ